MAGNFVVGQTSKVVLYAGMANEAVVKGINKMVLPLGWSSSFTTISEFGTPVDIQVATGLKYDTVACSGNFTLKDPTQALLRQWSLNATHVTSMRFYLDLCSFAALDLISNSGGYYQIGSCSAPSGEKSGVYSGGFDIAPAGASTLFENHIVGTDLSFTSGANPTVTSAAGAFITAGFAVGQIAIVDHNGAADPIYLKIQSVTAATITFEALGGAASITTAAGGATTALHSGAPMAFDAASASC